MVNPPKGIGRDDTNDETGSLVQRLDTLISLMVPPLSHFEDVAGGLQHQVLALCDHEHTAADIQKATGKSGGHVSKELSVLRSKGLVKTVRRGDRIVHIRVAP